MARCDGKTVAADGSQIDTWENNLLGETSTRYGGIAYRHVSNTHVAAGWATTPARTASRSGRRPSSGG
ncbi:Tn3 family transposase [Streptosporangium album]|uniref:Tn3 family transposase n=1 Tax=Streptosporangium album TaxID=47479 RepID=UPI0016135E62